MPCLPSSCQAVALPWLYQSISACLDYFALPFPDAVRILLASE